MLAEGFDRADCPSWKSAIARRVRLPRQYSMYLPPIFGRSPSVARARHHPLHFSVPLPSSSPSFSLAPQLQKQGNEARNEETQVSSDPVTVSSARASQHPTRSTLTVPKREASRGTAAPGAAASRQVGTHGFCPLTCVDRRSRGRCKPCEARQVLAGSRGNVHRPRNPGRPSSDDLPTLQVTCVYSTADGRHPQANAMKGTSSTGRRPGGNRRRQAISL
jgi:hypothetical protein